MIKVSQHTSVPLSQNIYTCIHVRPLFSIENSSFFLCYIFCCFFFAEFFSFLKIHSLKIIINTDLVRLDERVVKQTLYRSQRLSVIITWWNYERTLVGNVFITGVDKLTDTPSCMIHSIILHIRM